MITIVKLNGITNVDLVIGQWWLSGTDLLPCDWVACLQPPQAPAFTNLRHTGWWVLIISKTNNHQNQNPQNQVWRSDSIWRECEFCLWEGDGLWGGLSSNLLWSHLPGSPIKIFGTQHRCGNRVHRYQTNQDGSESGSTKGYFLVPEDDEWPNCVRGDPATHSTSFSKRKYWDNCELAGPLCSAPPEIPFEGSVVVIPGTFQVHPISSCQVKKVSRPGHQLRL